MCYYLNVQFQGQRVKTNSDARIWVFTVQYDEIKHVTELVEHLVTFHYVQNK